MNTKINALGVLLLFVLAVGCSTPLDRYAAAERTLQATADAVTAAADAGLLDGKPAAKAAIRAALTQGNSALAKAQPFALAGQDPSADFWDQQVLQAAATAAQQLATAKASKP